jgi:BirA family transcriptional regulator, biotin operon repressor / biotin---[acetyl-CoA-carboxylase] ligase
MIIGSNLIFLKNLTSTNTHAALILKNSEVPEGTIVYTNYQSAGRGQAGNSWESEDGKNLLVSAIIYPSMVSPAGQFLISMAFSLGIREFLREYIPDCKIKWPNDIYAWDDKIAGILIENSILDNKIQCTIAGIGLNINQEKFISDAPNPVSLKILTGIEYDLEICLRKLALSLDKRYRQLIREEYANIKDEYVKNLYRAGEWQLYRDLNGIFTGKIISVDGSGLLLVEKEDGKVNGYAFKEISFIP